MMIIIFRQDPDLACVTRTVSRLQPSTASSRTEAAGREQQAGKGEMGPRSKPRQGSAGFPGGTNPAEHFPRHRTHPDTPQAAVPASPRGGRKYDQGQTLTSFASLSAISGTF